MAKTTKRCAAVILAVIMLISMIPTAFAADNSFTVTCAKRGFTFTVFQIATTDATTGEYTPVATDADVVAELGKNLSSPAALLAACDNVNDTSTLGTKVGDPWLTDGSDMTFTGLADGIYYVKCTGTPVADASVTKNSIVVLPGTPGTEKFSVDSKVKDGSTPNVYKTFGDGTSADKYVGTNADISYTLKADITGTVSNKLEKFQINDKMDASLSKTDVAITSVAAVADNGTETPLTYDKIDNADGFSISIKAAELNKDSFYSKKQVVVNFTTKLTADAVTATKIENHDSLTYKFANQDAVTVDGQAVSVLTYDVSVLKVDATKDTKKLGGAKFAIYSDEACTTNLAEATTDSETGIATFPYKFATGTYYIKETSAPQGYNLNSTVFAVTVDGTQATTQITVEDTPTAVPQTGGVGTMMFTIGGISLIAVAGVLFVIVMKKRKAAK